MKAFAVTCTLLALLLGSGSTTAQTRDPDALLKRAQLALNILNQELTATYDQIKTLQAARSANDCASLGLRGNPVALTTEDEVAAAKRKLSARDHEVQSQLDAAFSHVKDIEAQKRPILQRLREYLSGAPAPEPAKAHAQ